MTGGRFARLAIRVGIGAAIITIVVYHAEPAQLAMRLRAIDPGWLGFALICSIMANVASAIRWAEISSMQALTAPARRLLPIYARGITLNVVLPGATLSGDLLRSLELRALGNPFPAAALSVLIDRVSGLWVLCGMSLLSTGLAAALGWIKPSSALTGYAAGLALAFAVPLLPWPGSPASRDTSPRGWLPGRLSSALTQLGSMRTVLVRSTGMSLVVQLLSALAFWGCAGAVQIHQAPLVIAAASAPIFIMAALPIGIAGFGIREAAAAVVLGALGVPAEQAISASLLYGACALAQGVLAAPLFLRTADGRLR